MGVLSLSSKTVCCIQHSWKESLGQKAVSASAKVCRNVIHPVRAPNVLMSTSLHLHPPKLSSCKSWPLCCVLPTLWVALWQPSLPDLQGPCPGLCVCAQPLSGIFQARILEWVAISYSWRSSQPRDRTLVSCVSCVGRWILYHCCHLGSPPWAMNISQRAHPKKQNRVKQNLLS